MIIYVNGDSYAAYSGGKRFSEFLGEHFKCKVINNSIPGSCNNRIFRTSLRDLIDLKNQNHEIKVVIFLSFLIRTELWDENIKNNKFINDGEFTSIQPTSNKKWFNNKLVDSLDYKDFCKQFLNYYNIEAETTKILQNLVLFSTWCRANNIDYIIFSSARQEPVDFTAPFIKNFYDEIINDQKIINIFEHSFTEWCIQNNFTPITTATQEIHGKMFNIGHHGEEAHKAFAHFLIDNYFQ